MLVRRCNGDQYGVHRKCSVTEIARALTKIGRCKIRQIAIDLFAIAAASKQAVEPQVALHLRSAVRRIVQRYPVDQLHIFVLLIIAAQRIHQDWGLVSCMSDKNAAVIGDVRYCFLRRHYFVFVLLLSRIVHAFT